MVKVEMLEGTLEVIVVEGPEGGTRYFLMQDDALQIPSSFVSRALRARARELASPWTEVRRATPSA